MVDTLAIVDAYTFQPHLRNYGIVESLKKLFAIHACLPSHFIRSLSEQSLPAQL